MINQHSTFSLKTVFTDNTLGEKKGLTRLVCLVCSLAKKKVAEKKVAITVFSFPPDKGNVGTAAYLNVFGSIYRVLQDLKAQGYSIEDVPEKEEDLIKMVSTQLTTLTVVPAGQ